MTTQTENDTGLVAHPSMFALPTGDELRAIRIVCGLSQNEAARRAGVSRMTVKRAENEVRDPQMSTVKALLDVYKEVAGDE